MKETDSNVGYFACTYLSPSFGNHEYAYAYTCLKVAGL